MTGKFIVIEGLDATGKSTLAEKLAKRLNATLLKCPARLEAPDLSEGNLPPISITVHPYSGALTIGRRTSSPVSKLR